MLCCRRGSGLVCGVLGTGSHWFPVLRLLSPGCCIHHSQVVHSCIIHISSSSSLFWLLHTSFASCTLLHCSCIVFLFYFLVLRILHQSLVVDSSSVLFSFLAVAVTRCTLFYCSYISFLFLSAGCRMHHPQVVHCSHLSFLFSFTLLAVLLFLFFLFAAAYSTRKLYILLLFIYFLPLLLYLQLDASSAGYTSLHCSHLLILLSHGSLFLFFSFLLLYIVYVSFLFHVCVHSCCMR